MTSVNEIQKINSIAKELLDHGMTTNRHDAVVMARKMLRSDESGEMFDQAQKSVPFKEKNHTPMVSGYTQPIEQTKEQVESSSTTSENSISTADLANAVQKNNDFLAKKLTEFQKQVEALKAEVGHYRKEFVDLKSSIMFKSRQSETTTQSKQSINQSSSQQESHTQEASENEEDDPRANRAEAKPEFVPGKQFEIKGGKGSIKNPKQGEYNPSNVSLDKIFYYGTK